MAVARRRVAIGGGGADRSGGRGRWCGTFGYVREKVAWRPSVGNKDPLKFLFFTKILIYCFTRQQVIWLTCSRVWNENGLCAVCV